MPTVKNLMDSRNGTPEAAGGVAVLDKPAPGAGGMALFSGGGLPATLPGDEQMDEMGGDFGAYVATAHPLNKTWAELQAAGIMEGNYYVALDGERVKQHPLKFWLYSAELFSTKLNAAGEVIAATRDITIKSPPGENPYWEEHYVSLVIVDMGDKLVPAKADFRGVKSGTLTNAIRNLRLAASPEFAGLSADHKLAAQFPEPWGRIYSSATTSPRTSKKSGKRYDLAACQSRPATLEQLDKLGKALTDPGFIQLATMAQQNYTDRVNEIAAKLTK